VSARLVTQLKSIIQNHPGSSAVMLHLESGETHKVLRFDDRHRVTPNSTFYAELKELLGPGAVI
jgi:DNA polymerase-3 subunit alpha